MGTSPNPKAIQQSALSRADFNTLLDPTLKIAKKLLGELGSFTPFAYVVNTEGKLAQFGFQLGPGKSARDGVTFAIQALRSGSKKFRAVALCMEVVTTSPGKTGKSDAIAVQMEHADGAALNIIVPYGKLASGNFNYGTLYATPFSAAQREARVFQEVRQ